MPDDLMPNDPLPHDAAMGNATFRVEPVWAFALDDEDFAGTPTRWTF